MTILNSTPVQLLKEGVPYWSGSFGKWSRSLREIDSVIADLEKFGQHKISAGLRLVTEDFQDIDPRNPKGI